MIILTRDEFLEATAIDIYLECQDGDLAPEQAAEIIFKRWSNILYKEVKKNSLRQIPDDDKLNENQVAVIKDVLCNLGLYYKTHGDVKALGCVDENGNPINAIPSDLIDDLRHCGLIKKSIGRRSIW